MKKEGFSTRQLATMKLPGAPGSHQGWEKHAVTHGWEIREHPGRGRGGIVREFMPPPPLAAIIARHQAGKKVSVEEVSDAMGKTTRGGQPRRTARPGKHAGSAKNALAKRDLGPARFAAWLAARMVARAERGRADERLLLDRHDLALRTLMLVAELERCSLATLQDHPDVVDRAIDLALAVKPAAGRTGQT